MKSYYQILEVSPDSSDEEIRDAYRRLSLKYHPDHFEGNPLLFLATEKQKELNEAYSILSDSEKCRNYWEEHFWALFSELPAVQPLLIRYYKTVARQAVLEGGCSEQLIKDRYNFSDSDASAMIRVLKEKRIISKYHSQGDWKFAEKMLTEAAKIFISSESRRASSYLLKKHLNISVGEGWDIILLFREIEIVRYTDGLDEVIIHYKPVN